MVVMTLERNARPRAAATQLLQVTTYQLEIEVVKISHAWSGS